MKKIEYKDEEHDCLDEVILCYGDWCADYGFSKWQMKLDIGLLSESDNKNFRRQLLPILKRFVPLIKEGDKKERVRQLKKKIKEVEES